MRVGTCKKRAGQATLEYLLILAVVIAAVAVASTAIIRPAVDTTLGNAGGAITNAAAELATGLQ